MEETQFSIIKEGPHVPIGLLAIDANALLLRQLLRFLESQSSAGPRGTFQYVEATYVILQDAGPVVEELVCVVLVGAGVDEGNTAGVEEGAPGQISPAVLYCG